MSSTLKQRVLVETYGNMMTTLRKTPRCQSDFDERSHTSTLKDPYTPTPTAPHTQAVYTNSNFQHAHTDSHSPTRSHKGSPMYLFGGKYFLVQVLPEKNNCDVFFSIIKIEGKKIKSAQSPDEGVLSSLLLLAPEFK